MAGRRANLDYWEYGDQDHHQQPGNPDQNAPHDVDAAAPVASDGNGAPAPHGPPTDPQPGDFTSGHLHVRVERFLRSHASIFDAQCEALIRGTPDPILEVLLQYGPIYAARRPIRAPQGSVVEMRGNRIARVHSRTLAPAEPPARPVRTT